MGPKARIIANKEVIPGWNAMSSSEESDYEENTKKRVKGENGLPTKRPSARASAGRVKSLKESSSDSESSSSGEENFEDEEQLSSGSDSSGSNSEESDSESSASSSGDEPVSAKKRPRTAVKKTPPVAQKKASSRSSSSSSGKVKSEKKVVKLEDRIAKVKSRSKVERLEEARKAFKWWEVEDLPDGINWRQMEHSGIYFAESYVPHDVPLVYDGQEVQLTPEEEEVASFYAAMPDDGPQLGNPKTRKVFQKNFMEDFKEVLGSGSVIKKFSLCDFSRIRTHLERAKQLKKAATAEEKLVRKREKEKISLKFGYALIDGRIEKVLYMLRC